MELWRRAAALAAAGAVLLLMMGSTPVIDAGHGGFDGGAVAEDGTVESGLNLAIARRLELIFLLCGTEPVMLRKTDEALGSGDSVHSAKAADLRERAARTDAVPGGILLSIHQNSYPSPRSRGAQVFWASEESRAFAEDLQEVCRRLDPANTRQAKPVPGNVYLFSHVSRPALLIECGFLTNREDLARLKNDDYQKLLACSIAACYFRRDGSWQENGRCTFAANADTKQQSGRASARPAVPGTP